MNVLDRGGSPNEPPPGEPEVPGPGPAHRSASLAPGNAAVLAGEPVSTVQFTGTRVVAMGVHATYDIVAIALISREALAGPPALTTTSAIATGRSWGR